MKYFVILWCLLAPMCQKVHAQESAAALSRKPSANLQPREDVTNNVVAKGEFLKKAASLNELLENGKMDEAKSKWAEIKTLIHKEFLVTEQGYHQSKKSGTEKEVNNRFSGHRSRARLYNELTVLVVNMQSNRLQIQKLLIDLAANLY